MWFVINILKNEYSSTSLGNNGSSSRNNTPLWALPNILSSCVQKKRNVRLYLDFIKELFVLVF
jgi:hypothetical protein